MLLKTGIVSYDVHISTYRYCHHCPALPLSQHCVSHCIIRIAPFDQSDETRDSEWTSETDKKV